MHINKNTINNEIEIKVKIIVKVRKINKRITENIRSKLIIEKIVSETGS